MPYVSQGGFTAQGNVFKDAWGGIKDIGGAALDVYGAPAYAEGQAAANDAYLKAMAARGIVPSKPLPPWVLPAALGGGALLLVFMMRR